MNGRSQRRPPTRRLLPACAVAVFAQATVVVGCDDEASGGTGSVLWVRNLHDTDAQGLRVVVDSRDQITIAAYQAGVVSLSGDPADELGNDDGTPVLIVARYTSAGDHVWSMAFDGAFNPASRIGLAVAGNGDVVLAVSEGGDGIDFGDGVVGTLEGTAEGLLASFANLDGSLRWKRELLDAPFSIAAADLAIAGSTVYLVGKRWLALDTGGAPLAVPGNPSLYVEAFDLATGVTSWRATHGTGSPVLGDRVAVRPDGDIYVSGTYMGFLELGNGLTNAAQETFFLTRMGGSDGAPLWGKSFARRSGALEIAADSRAAAIVVGDFFLRDEDAAEAEPDTSIPLMTIAKFPSFDGSGGGDEAWSWFVGRGVGGEEPRASSVDVDSYDNVVVGGEFIGTLVFGTQRLYADRVASLFVLKMEPDEGKAVWARYSGGTDRVIAADVCADSADNVLATGVFLSSVAEGSPQPAELPNEIFFLKLAR